MQPHKAFPPRRLFSFSPLFLHVAYNMIHPERYIRHEPFHDFWKGDTVCRELDQKYGLVIDNGRGKDKQWPLGEKATFIEATQASNTLNPIPRPTETIFCMVWQRQRIGKRSMRDMPSMAWR